MEHCRWEEGTIGTSGCRLGADEGQIGGADRDETRRQQTPQNRLRVYYHVLEGGERVLGACWGTEELGWNEGSRKKLRDVR